MHFLFRALDSHLEDLIHERARLRLYIVVDIVAVVNAGPRRRVGG